MVAPLADEPEVHALVVRGQRHVQAHGHGDRRTGKVPTSGAPFRYSRSRPPGTFEITRLASGAPGGRRASPLSARPSRATRSRRPSPRPWNIARSSCFPASRAATTCPMRSMTVASCSPRCTNMAEALGAGRRVALVAQGYRAERDQPVRKGASGPSQVAMHAFVHDRDREVVERRPKCRPTACISRAAGTGSRSPGHLQRLVHRSRCA